MKPNYFHSEFQKNVDNFLSAQNYWKSLCLEAVRFQNVQDDWTLWFSGKFADGSLDISGNPIYSLVNKELKKGIRIIQIPPNGDKYKIKAWTDYFAKGLENEINELVVICQLSESSGKIAKQLIQEWVIDEKTDVFSKKIDDILSLQE